MLQHPHINGISSYLTYGWKGWSNPGRMNQDATRLLGDVMESTVDLVAFTPEVTNLLLYLTGRFALSEGFLTEDVIKNIEDEKSVSLACVVT
ncbi:unnamed protein product [Choristocarpus tenellus]